MGFVYMKHPDLDGGARFPDDSSVIEAQAARGWQLHSMPAEFDPDAPNTGETVQAAEVYASEPILSEEQFEALRGKALDEALEAAGLPKSGTVAEKRDRLAEHEAELAATNNEGNE